MNSIIKKALSILSESSKKFNAYNSTPDKAYFDGKVFRWHESLGPFGFIGPDEILVYNSGPFETHNNLYQDIITNYKTKDLKRFGELSDKDTDYAIDKQNIDNITNGNSKISTKSGRIWTKNISHTVIVFWCREKDITKENLESLKTNLKLKDFYWAGIDSKFYNHYGDDVNDLDGNEVKELTAAEIKKIITIAHENPGAKLSSRDRDIIKAAKGGDNIEAILKDMKRKSGGFSTMAQRNAAMSTSESTED